MWIAKFTSVDQQLISYRCLLFMLGRPLHTSLRLHHHFKSDRDDISQDCSSSECTHQLTEFDFRYDVILSRWRPWRYFMKSQRPHSFRTDQHEIWYSFLHINMHRLTDFWFLLSEFQDDVHEVLSQSAVLPPSEWKWNVCRVNMHQAAQFLIFSTFVT